MSADPRQITVLFADVCGSTGIYERLGDEAAHSLLEKVIGIMKEEVLVNEGRVVKTIGDEVMACFPRPGQALEAVKAMHQRLTCLPPGITGDVVGIHVGLQHGEVVEQEGDLFGEAVNVAARLTAMAKPWQILTSSETISALGAEQEEVSRHVTRTAVRGKRQEMDVYEIILEEDGLTRFSDKPLPEARTIRLVLTLREQRVEVTPERPVVTLGRGRQNDLVVSDKRVSRWHAQIECRRDRFFLVDKSTNGTVVVAAGKPSMFVNYGEISLNGGGSIFLGGDTDADSPNIIIFAVD
jgi:adenylate cyclase